MSELEVLRFTVAIGALVMAAEDVVARGRISEDGPYAWSVQRADWPRGLVRTFLDGVFSSTGLTLTLAARVVASLGLLVSPHVFDALVLIVGTWLWAVRWRGTYNGGSDQMMLVVLGGLGFYLARPDWAYGAMAFVSANLITAYVVAGAAKLRNPAWRDGRAVHLLAETYGLPVPPRATWIIAWIVMSFELSFPLALSSPRAALVYAAAGLVFHGINAYAFGLNRFLLAWAGAYPALSAIASSSGQR